MAFTTIQQLRRMRAKNKGSNRRVAASLRITAEWLDKKGPEEFSASEIKQLQTLAKSINLRLETNAHTKRAHEIWANIEKEMKKAGTSRPRPR